MNVVVLDGYTLNPGDLSWKELNDLGNTEIYDRTGPDIIMDRAKDADILITNKTPVTADVINAIPRLKYIGMLATGYDVVDVNAAEKKQIPVCNVPLYGTVSVAQMAFAHILNLTNQVHHHALTVADGKWSQSPDFCYWDFPLLELEGKNLGILGYGRIGRALARIGKAFGMRILTDDRNLEKDSNDDITRLPVDTLFAQSDILSLHCPLTRDTHHVIDAHHLGLMKPTAFLINTSRGGLVCEDDLADALNTGIIAGAGLDVVSVEPVTPDNPLLSARNCFITPHIAWATKAARQRLMDAAVENVRKFLNGSITNSVNGISQVSIPYCSEKNKNKKLRKEKIICLK